MANCNSNACNHRELTTSTGRTEVTWSRRRADGTSESARLNLCDTCVGSALDAVRDLADAPDMFNQGETPDGWPENFSV
jgi:hypothetical protein